MINYLCNIPIIGRIHNSLGGSYAVKTETGVFACRARGLFRKQGLSPLTGDNVRIELVQSSGKPSDIEGYIVDILPRKNELRRPPVANLDQLFMLSSTAKPRPNLKLLDSLIATAELAGIEPVIIFTKCDLADGESLAQVYRNCGFKSFAVSFGSDSNINAIASLLGGKLSAFCGNTGVGKSTLLNRIAPGLQLPTGEISEKLGRGRHTTRHVELFPVAGGWVADTPGFSSFEAERQAELTKDNLAEGFREFSRFAHCCRFTDCAHVKDSGCAVIAAVHAGEIPQSRHESYAALYDVLKDKKDWET